MLDQILNDMIVNANAMPGKTQIRRLNSGLYIVIVWNDPKFTMTLSREKVHPGPAEMKTCIGLLPDNVERPKMDSVIKTTFNERPSLRVGFEKVKEEQFKQIAFADDDEAMEPI
jgi:hypothetical protein